LNSDSRINLTGMTQKELETFAESIDEKRFRGKQLFHWIYQSKLNDFEPMTNIAKSLRIKLSKTAALGHLVLQKRSVSSSGSIKYLFRLADGHFIESVYIPEDDRHTLCVSSQVGCALMCAFCATGKMGFRRNLSAGEIVDQVLYVERNIGRELTNVVFMGMGEPLKNYDAVVKAAKLMSHPDGIAIGTRHIVISTAGIIPEIYRFADDGHKFKLAISLHSAINEKRQQVMPISQKYHVQALVQAIHYYINKSGRRPTIEVVLLKNVNDGYDDAMALKKMVENMPCKINLIPYNPTVEDFQRPNPQQVDRFAQWLLPCKAPISVRWSKGDDIDAACGQLATSELEKELSASF
jgi:23S rRNA (adenine2503-C2)-methyltransferase